MKKKKLKLPVLVLLILTLFLFSGCDDAAEVDDEVYTIAIGVDKGAGQNLRITVQYPIYKGGGGQKSSGGDSEGKEYGAVDGTIVSSIEAPSVLEAFNLFNTSLGRRISLMHAKMIVFSEEIAREGVSKYIAPITRYRETRRTMRVVVSKTSAEEFLQNMNPLIGESIPKGVELLFEQYKTNGLFPNSTLTEFYKDLTLNYEQPYAIYASINNMEDSGKQNENAAANVSDNTGTSDALEYVAGKLIRKGGPKIDFLGTALFKGDKMTGMLDGYETRFFLMLTGNFKRGDITLNDINKKDNKLVFDVRQGRRPKLKVSFQDNKPVIDVNLNIEADIVSIQSRIKYEKSSAIGGVEQQLKSYLENGIRNMIEKTQKQFESDVIGFGRKAAIYFSTVKQWEDYKWPDHYKDASVNVNVNVFIRRSGLIYEAVQIVKD